MASINEYDNEQLKKPAIGIIASQTDTDALVRAVALAKQRGHAVIVAHNRQSEPEAMLLVRQLGAETIQTDKELADEDELRRVLTTAARVRGFPGVIYNPSPKGYIDFERTREKFYGTEDFTVLADSKCTLRSTAASVLVAIPAYNEEATIGDVVRSARKAADTVLVVDDGSDDDTAAVAESAGATVVQHQENGGYGASLKTAFVEARRRGADHLVTLDGDGQHDPSDITRLVRAQQESDSDIVIGSRFADEAETRVPRYRRFGLWTINLLTNLSLGVVRKESRVADTQSGFRAYGSEAIRTLARDDELGSGMGISTDILYHAHKHGYDIEEVGTVIDYDVEDGSSHNPVWHGYRLVTNILNTIERTRPLLSLALPGILLVLVGIGVAYWGFVTYVQLQQFPMWQAFTTLSFVLAGVFLCLIGIVLHSLNKYFDTASSVDGRRVR